MITNNKNLTLFNVQTNKKHTITLIEGTVQLNDNSETKVRTLKKDTQIVFHYHKNSRNQQTTKYFLNQKYTNMYNLINSINA